jgi:ribosomal-protein-alanine N-acetyltransferase
MTEFLFSENIDEIVSLQLENGFFDGWNEQMLKSGFNRGDFYCLGIKKDGKLIAFISFILAEDSCDICDVLVDKNHRRTGLANVLITDALKIIKNAGKKSAILEVRESNESAINLYKKFGFKMLTVRKNYYSDGENASILVKEID